MKLHLGCGKRYIPGFIHIDAVDYPHVDHVSQIDSLPFIADNSVDLIYACHVLEHFKRNDTARVLTEWKRVLKPKGILRLAVPDFGAVCEVYQKYGGLDLIIGLIFGRQDYIYNIHYNVFDYASLTKLLKEVGFTGGGGGRNPPLQLARNRAWRYRRLFAGLYPAYGQGKRRFGKPECRVRKALNAATSLLRARVLTITRCCAANIKADGSTKIKMAISVRADGTSLPTPETIA